MTHADATLAVIFEDLAPLPGAGGLNALSPLADLRPAFDIRTGALTTIERLGRSLALKLVALLPREELLPLCRELHASTNVTTPSDLAASLHATAASGSVSAATSSLLFINARCVLPIPEITALCDGQMLIESSTGSVIAAVGSAALAASLQRGERPSLVAKDFPKLALLSRPWHVRTFRDRAIAVDLELLGNDAAFQPASSPTQPPPGCLRFGSSRLSIHPTAKIYPGVTFDLEAGPIVIDQNAVVRPGVVMCGPFYLGANSTAGDRSLLKPNTAIGPFCKVAGEISGTIIQGYSNKGHDGHLGDSWLGEWVNLGAGTTNSNLLNTYGEVIAKALPSGTNERTGEQFLGAIIGDHVKTAICTRLMTGCVIHTGAMCATTAAVSGCVESFAWCTDAGNRRYRLDKFVEVAKAMMARRRVMPSVEYLKRITGLHVGTVE